MGGEKADIVVVSGVPRSGTSMLMQMLAAGGMPILHDDVRPADPDNPRGYLEFASVAKSHVDTSWIQHAPGKAVKVIHALLQYLPLEYPYKVVFMHRSLEEVLMSQHAMLARLGKPASALPKAQMIQMFSKQVDTCLAWLSQQHGFEVLELQYPDVIAQPDRAAAELAKFIGRSLDTSAMAQAVDSTLYRHRLSSTASVGEAQ